MRPLAVFARNLVLLFAVWRYGLHYLGARLLSATGMRRGGETTTRARLLRDMLQGLGPLYVKLGQILSTRPDIVPEDIVHALRTLQQDGKAAPDRRVRQILNTSLGPERMAAFDGIEDRPSYAASISQVYRGRLRDRTVVAVKVLKPSVGWVLRTDTAVIRFWAGLFRWLPAFRNLPVMETLSVFEAMLVSQTDFTNERRNAALFAEHFRSNRYVRFPIYHDALCTEAVLTMDYIGGLRPLDTLEPNTHATRELVTRALHALFKMIFVTGHVHADLHSGNILHTADGRIFILDTGLVATLSNADRVQFADFFIGMALGIGEKCADVVIETATYVPVDFRADALRADMDLIVAKHHGRVTSDYEILEFVTDIFELQRHHGVVGTTKFMTTILSLLVFEGLIKKLVPDYDFQHEASLFIASVKLNAAGR